MEPWHRLDRADAGRGARPADDLLRLARVGRADARAPAVRRSRDAAARPPRATSGSALTPDRLARSVRHHPKIGDRDALRRASPRTAPPVGAGAGGVDGASDDVLDALAEGNRAYEQGSATSSSSARPAGAPSEMLELLAAAAAERRRNRDPRRRRGAGEDHRDPVARASSDRRVRSRDQEIRLDAQADSEPLRWCPPPPWCSRGVAHPGPAAGAAGRTAATPPAGATAAGRPRRAAGASPRPAASRACRRCPSPSAAEESR